MEDIMEELDQDLIEKLDIIFSSTFITSTQMIEYKEVEEPCVA